MKLSIVYGKTGTGKSNCIYESIKNNSKNNKIYLIVPEQCNLFAEKKLLEILNTDTLINIEVLTLKRMAYKIIIEQYGNYYKTLNNVGKNLIIYDAIQNNKNDLNFLNKNDKNIDIASKAITEFKKHNITLDILKNTDIKDKYTYLKLKDISLIYEKYEDKISNEYMDENDDLSLLANLLPKTEFAKDTLIYFDEFDGFTPQEYLIFERLLEKAKQVYISVCLDDLTIKNKEDDIFYFNKKFINKIKDIAKKLNVEVEEKQLTDNKKHSSYELQVLEENFSLSNKTIFKQIPENIELFLADNPYSELEYVAKKIIDLAKNGFRYKNIAILCANTEEYFINAKMIFEKYNIPLYLDYKKSLDNNILIKFIISILNIFSENFSEKSVINYLKIGLLNFENESIFEFEKYCKKWGIRNKKFLSEFEYEPSNVLQDKLEEIRKELINPLVDLKEKINNSKTVKNITQNIYEFIVENKIIDNLNEKIQKINDIEIFNEYSTSYKLLIELLDEIVNLFGNGKITFDKYKDLLNVGLNSEEIGTIPATQDQVILGQINRAKLSDIEVCFIIGTNDGIFPIILNSEGYFNDKDRQILSENGIELAKNSIDSLYEDEFNIYKTLLTPSKKLFITYPSTNNLGGALRPSVLIKKIKKIFPSIIENSDIIEKNNYIIDEELTFNEALNKYLEMLSGKKIDNSWIEIIKYYQIKNKEKFKSIINAISYNNNAKNISKENIEKAYKNELHASVSKLEEYQKCPFSYHMKYGLNLKEEKEFKMQVIDTGNFMHEVIDNFFTYLDDNFLDLNVLTDEEIDKIVCIIIDDLLMISKYYIFTSSAKFRSLTRRLKNVVLDSMRYIIYTIKNSDFKVEGHEIEFGKNKKYPGILLDLEDGKKVELSGKIDRMDIGYIGGKKVLRIIDYKSSSKSIDLNKVIGGLQIQLLAYIDSMTKNINAESAGVLYMSMIENVVKSSKNKTDEEIKNEIKKNFRMQGLIVSDIKIIKMMDKNLENGQSDIIPVTLKKDGSIASKSSTLLKEDFEILQKQINKIIKQISKNILSGKIDIKPYKYNTVTACDYCSYKSICMFDETNKNNNYKYIKHDSKEEILDRIKSNSYE